MSRMRIDGSDGITKDDDNKYDDDVNGSLCLSLSSLNSFSIHLSLLL